MKKIKELWDKYKIYIISIAIPIGVGIFSALITMKNMQLFDEINKPPLSPPRWLFPIIWTILYVLMGLSSARIYNLKEAQRAKVREALYCYLESLVVNFAWSIIFFNFGAFLLAFLWILLLLFLIVKGTILYGKLDRVSAYLQIPYIIWVSFATYLTFCIMLLN